MAGDAPAVWPTGWPVGIAAPWMGAEQENVLRLWLKNGALATSGVDYRHWQVDGERKHHIIDPLSGDSAETELLTVSVLHEDMCVAEAWATAALVASSTGSSLDLLTQHNLKAALIDQMQQVVLTEPLRPLVQWEI